MNKNQRVLFCKFSTLLRDFADEIPNEWTIANVWEYKTINQNIFSLNQRNPSSLTKALSWLEADLNISLICRLKFSRLSRSVPKSLTDCSMVTVSFPIEKPESIWSNLLLLIMIALNLCGLTTILFSENHLFAVSDSNFNECTSSWIICKNA